MGGAFCRNARTDAVEGQQTAYVNLWDPLAHGHWPGADGRFGGGEADAGDSRNGGVDDLERLRPPLAVRTRFQDTCRRRSRRRTADRPEARAVAGAPEGAACDRTEPRSSRGTWPASAAALGGCAAPCGVAARGSTGVSAAMSPRDALEWVSLGRALEDALGRLRGERARTSRGCGGVSAGQGDIGAVEDSMSDAEYIPATRTA